MNNKVFSALAENLIKTSRVVDLLTASVFFNKFKNKDFEKEDTETIRKMVDYELTNIVSNIKYAYKIYLNNNISSYKKSIYNLLKSSCPELYFGESSFHKELNGHVFKSVFSSKNIKKKSIDELIYLFLSKILISNNNKNFDVILNNISRFDEESNPIKNAIYEFLKVQQQLEERHREISL